LVMMAMEKRRAKAEAAVARSFRDFAEELLAGKKEDSRDHKRH
jgi:hypothetical protein